MRGADALGEVTRTSCDTKFVLLWLMKNVTITMDDTVADWARVEAARRNTSVSRLVGEMLTEKMRHDDGYERAMNEWLQRKSFGKSDGKYPSREETYQRRPMP